MAADTEKIRLSSRKTFANRAKSRLRQAKSDCGELNFTVIYKKLMIISKKYYNIYR